jgi:hypothetical protein
VALQRLWASPFIFRLRSARDRAMTASPSGALDGVGSFYGAGGSGSLTVEGAARVGLAISMIPLMTALRPPVLADLGCGNCVCIFTLLQVLSSLLRVEVAGIGVEHLSEELQWGMRLRAQLAAEQAGPGDGLPGDGLFPMHPMQDVARRVELVCADFAHTGAVAADIAFCWSSAMDRGSMMCAPARKQGPRPERTLTRSSPAAAQVCCRSDHAQPPAPSGRGQRGVLRRPVGRQV